MPGNVPGLVLEDNFVVPGGRPSANVHHFRDPMRAEEIAEALQGPRRVPDRIDSDRLTGVPRASDRSPPHRGCSLALDFRPSPFRYCVGHRRRVRSSGNHAYWEDRSISWPERAEGTCDACKVIQGTP